MRLQEVFIMANFWYYLMDLHISPTQHSQAIGWPQDLYASTHQLVSRPADQKYNAFYYIMDEQFYNLTAHDMRSASVNEVMKTIGLRLPLEHLCPMSYPHPFLYL